MKNYPFEEYFVEITANSDRLNYNYIGISRKEFPKWTGWKIINSYKSSGTDIKDIDDDVLKALVRNFHYIRFLEQN